MWNCEIIEKCLRLRRCLLRHDVHRTSLNPRRHIFSQLDKKQNQSTEQFCDNTWVNARRERQHATKTEHRSPSSYELIAAKCHSERHGSRPPRHDHVSILSSSSFRTESLTRSHRMTLGEKVEQSITGRPNSLMPGHTLRALLNLSPRPDSEMNPLNWAFHYGTGISVGAIRALMASSAGLIGPLANFLFMGVRLAIDQTLENATGVGSPPWWVCLIDRNWSGRKNKY